MKLTSLYAGLLVTGLGVAVAILLARHLHGEENVLPGSACPATDAPPAPTTIVFRGRIVGSGLPRKPLRVIPVDIDPHFLLAVEVEDAEGCIPGGLPRRTNFLIHSPALFFGFQLGRLPRESGGAVAGTYSFRLQAEPIDADRWTFDLSIRDLAPAAVGLLLCRGDQCRLESDQALDAGVHPLALDGQGGTRAIDVGEVVGRPPGAAVALVNGAPARFGYRAISYETGDFGPAAVFRLWARAPAAEDAEIAWDWHDPPERLTRCLTREGVHFGVERPGDGGADLLWRGDYPLDHGAEPTCP